VTRDGARSSALVLPDLVTSSPSLSAEPGASGLKFGLSLSRFAGLGEPEDAFELLCDKEKEKSSSLFHFAMGGLSAIDLQIFQEKNQAFLGSVKIPMEKLQHEELPDNPRQRDDENIATLVNIFHDDGCPPREPDNHVPVLISRSAVPDSFLRVSDDFQLFNPDHALTYLEGRHELITGIFI
ncbi:hypothetical protein MMC14_010784, partial [Varicellaria rhodocarpa]|nr:hypothetical protein [Varicellaria rhodocarpa]